jgi:hypothetical protein
MQVVLLLLLATFVVASSHNLPNLLFTIRAVQYLQLS